VSFSDIWDSIVDGFDYFIHFEWVGDAKDGIAETFSNIPEWFTSDSPVASIWFWVFYGFFLVGIWILPSSFGLPDYKLWEKIIGSIIFFVIDMFIVSHFRDG
jgi:hypothetical protein